VTVHEKHPFAIRLTFTSAINSISWNLVVVYGHCRQPDRDEFVNCLYNLDLDEEDLWLFMGDFNFYRYAENRNRSGGNFNDLLVFNNIISHQGLVEIPIKGRSFTWSNMQSSPLLEQLDWVFTSPSSTSQFPLTVVIPLAKTTSDHLPCKIQIGTNIPRLIFLDLKTIGLVILLVLS
jgi:endonuclease/exonuclease/phosphatase family metal-dependent hydrolase